MDRNSIKSMITSGNSACLVLQGDCIDILKQLPAGVIDLTITDPAYESLERHRAVGTTTRLKASKASSNAWFTVFPNARYGELFEQLYRVHRPNSHCYVFCDSETEAVALTGINPYADQPAVRTALSGGWRAWPSLTWVKTKKAVNVETQDRDSGHQTDAWLEQEMVRSGMGYHWRRAEERILFLEKGKRKLNNLGWPNVMCGTRAGKNQFPTEKPENIIERLILNSTNEGDLILDTFAGSGVVGRVASRLGRRSILIDLDVSWIQAHPISGMGVITVPPEEKTQDRGKAVGGGDEDFKPDLDDYYDRALEG